jgi:hypothetical protein
MERSAPRRSNYTVTVADEFKLGEFNQNESMSQYTNPVK